MNNQRMICCRCGQVCAPRADAGGSFGVEIALWLVAGPLALVGLFAWLPLLLAVAVPVVYGVWRLSAAKTACPHCGASELVSPCSPRGRAIQEGRFG